MSDRDKVFGLLQQLADEGAEVKDSSNVTESALTADALKEMSSMNDFQAWVSWNKSF